MFYLTKNWYEILKDEFDKDYFKSLQKFLKDEYTGQTIYPEAKNVFAALNLTKFDDVRVVIIGQDPYINPKQAHGLCFSVESTSPPPSLKNIYKELCSDCGCTEPGGGNLTKWARQGVLLLNSVLTVRAGSSFSHKGRGWEQFTHKIIELLSRRSEPVIFLVWGAGAKKILEDIDLSRHAVLYAAHPSPLSAGSGFFGCRHFSKVNRILKERNMPEIDWQID